MPPSLRQKNPRPKMRCRKNHQYQKKEVVRPRDEFRTYKKSGHPAYIYEKVGGKYKFLGITESPVTQGVKNIKLEQNPEPDNPEHAYIKTKYEVNSENQFKERKKGWELTPSDKEKIKKYKK